MSAILVGVYDKLVWLNVIFSDASHKKNLGVVLLGFRNGMGLGTNSLLSDRLCLATLRLLMKPVTKEIHLGITLIGSDQVVTRFRGHAAVNSRHH